VKTDNSKAKPFLALIRSATAWAWFWTVLDVGNGAGHLLFSVERGGHFPGAATAPLLLICAGWLGVTLVRGLRLH
jgi:hypothetical protein